jgi:PAS domain S-box-containing protein
MVDGGAVRGGVRGLAHRGRDAGDSGNSVVADDFFGYLCIVPVAKVSFVVGGDSFFPVVLALLLVPNNGVYETPVFVALRSAAYLAVAWVAVGLSRYRWDSERRLEGLLTLFDSLQTPIVVSDIDGNIKFANRACCELLGRSADEIKDTNFFAVFSQPDRRGQSIEDYLKRFDKNANQSAPMTVSIQSPAGVKVLRANCVSMQWDHQRLLVTQLS